MKTFILLFLSALVTLVYCSQTTEQRWTEYKVWKWKVQWRKVINFSHFSENLLQEVRPRWRRKTIQDFHGENCNHRRSQRKVPQRRKKNLAWWCGQIHRLYQRRVDKSQELDRLSRSWTSLNYIEWIDFTRTYLFFS